MFRDISLLSLEQNPPPQHKTQEAAMASQHMQIRSKTGFSVAIEHLESLIDSLKRGTIFINQGEKSILLKPSEPVDFEVEAGIKPNDGICGEKIALRLKWEIRESRM
jgi:amphi-Trp domain-containing protein